MNAAKDRACNIRRSISRQGSATFNALVGINNLAPDKPYDAYDPKRAPLRAKNKMKRQLKHRDLPQDEILDAVASHEWRDILT